MNSRFPNGPEPIKRAAGAGTPTVTAYDATIALHDLGIEYLGTVEDRDVHILCPLSGHDDHHPSCRVRTGIGIWYCDPCGEGGDFPKLLTALGLTGREHAAALAKYALGRVEVERGGHRDAGDHVEVPRAAWAALDPGPFEKSPSPPATYVYTHDFRTVRYFDGEQPKPRHLNKSGKTWLDGAPGGAHPLMGADDLGRLEKGSQVYVLEGEKDVMAAREAGLTATTNPFGINGYRKTDWGPLAGQHITVVADRDRPGIQGAYDKANFLMTREVASVRIVCVAVGKDFSDLIWNGGSVADLVELPEVVDVEREPAKNPHADYVLVPATDVAIKKRRWLIPGLLPLGAPTGVYGAEKAGKTIYAGNLATQMTLGEIGDDGPQNVLVVAYEDDHEEWVARLAAAGADLSRVSFLLMPATTVDGKPDGDRDMQLPGDLKAFEGAIVGCAARLVIIDPITDSVDQTMDTTKRQDVKSIARNLKNLASKTNVAMLAINHWNRSNGGTARDRVADSIAWRQSFRSNIGFFPHPTHPDKRVISQTGTNWARGDTQYWFTLIEVPITDSDGETMMVPVVSELAEVPEEDRLGEAELFKGPKVDKQPSKPEACAEAMRVFLVGNGPTKRTELFRFLVTEGEFTEYAFEEAGQILKVDSKPLLGQAAGHLWKLPNQSWPADPPPNPTTDPSDESDLG